MKVYLIYFSPTTTTQQVLRAIVAGTGINKVTEIDLTLPQARVKHPFVIEDDALIIFGSPVYCGRIPVQAIEAIQQIRGNGQPSVCVAVYGNQRIGDALLELADTVQSNGFEPMAAAGFIGEHSYSTSEYNIASGRPDETDCEKAREFGKRIMDKLEANELSVSFIPGEHPYMPHPELPFHAPEKSDDCVQCLHCRDICPVGAINALAEGDTNRCIFCFACVKGCPTHSRMMNDPRFVQIGQKMSAVPRKEPEWYI